MNIKYMLIFSIQSDYVDSYTVKAYLSPVTHWGKIVVCWWNPSDISFFLSTVQQWVCVINDVPQLISYFLYSLLMLYINMKYIASQCFRKKIYNRFIGPGFGLKLLFKKNICKFKCTFYNSGFSHIEFHHTAAVAIRHFFLQVIYLKLFRYSLFFHCANSHMHPR